MACVAAAWPSLAASASASAAARRSARATARRSDSASRARDAASSRRNDASFSASFFVSTSSFIGVSTFGGGGRVFFSARYGGVFRSSRLDAREESDAPDSGGRVSSFAASETALATVAATSSSFGVKDFGSRFIFPLASSAFGPSAVTAGAGGSAGDLEATRVASTTEVVAFDARDDDPATSPFALPLASSARVGSRSSRLLSDPVTTAAFSVTFAAAVAVPSAVSLTSSPPSFRASVANSLNPSFSCAHMTARAVPRLRECHRNEGLLVRTASTEDDAEEHRSTPGDALFLSFELRRRVALCRARARCLRNTIRV